MLGATRPFELIANAPQTTSCSSDLTKLSATTSGRRVTSHIESGARHQAARPWLAARAPRRTSTALDPTHRPEWIHF